MLTIEQESEILQISHYSEIIIQILYMHKALSLIKLITFAYIIKNGKYDLYNSKNTKELTYRSISLLSGNYSDFINNIKPILKSINILVSNQRIELENSIVKLIHYKSVLNQMYEKESFIYKAINDSKRMSDRQFLKEVITNV
ncbi:MAG: hypothetical protein V8R83_05450 [Candidatus Gastranaerophilaceae bacterium]